MNVDIVKYFADNGLIGLVVFCTMGFVYYLEKAHSDERKMWMDRSDKISEIMNKLTDIAYLIGDRRTHNLPVNNDRRKNL